MGLLRIRLDSETEVTLETDDQQGTGLQPYSAGSSILVSFQEAIRPARELALSLVHNFRSSLPDSPDEIEVTFSLKGSLEVGGFVVGKVATEGNYSVTLKWKAKRSDEPSESAVR